MRLIQMKITDCRDRSGFTLIELMVTILISVMVFGGIGLVIADSHRGWNKMYNRNNTGVVPDSYVAGKAFDHICRRAYSLVVVLGGSSDTLTVFYYANPAALPPEKPEPLPDSYARFYLSGTNLMVDYGSLVPNTFNLQSPPASTQKLAEKISSVRFSVPERGPACTQMMLTLDNAMTITYSSIRHN